MLWLLLTGCLLLAKQPPCDLSQCGRFMCDEYSPGECASFCSEDEDCKPGNVCYGTCVPACDEASCKGGMACNRFGNACNEYCVEDEDCRDEYFCCELRDEGCSVNTCVRL